MLEARNLSIRFGGLKAVEDVSLAVPRGAIVGPDRPERRREDDALHPRCPDSSSRRLGAVAFDGRDITGLPPHAICRLGMTRTFQIVQPFAAQTVRENIAVGAHLHHPGRAARARAGRGGRPPGRPRGRARQARAQPDDRRPQAARARARARHRPDAPAARRGARRPQSAGDRRDDPGDPGHPRIRRHGADDRARDAGGDEPGRRGLRAQQRPPDRPRRAGGDHATIRR